MLGAMLVGAVFITARSFQVDPDLWWHIKTGQNILATHHWPTTDPYSFTVSGTPWVAYEWLGEVLLGTVARFAGLRGLDALLMILGAAIAVALYAYGTQRSGNSKAGFAAAATLLVLADVSFSLRPQMLGYLFIILTLIVLEQFRQNKPRALWFLPPLFLVWVNTHGSFIIGLGVILVYWAAGLKAFRFGEIEAQCWTRGERRCRICLSSVPCRAPSHPLRNPPSCLSVRYGLLPANQRGEHHGMATHAVPDLPREIFPGLVVEFSSVANCLSLQVAAGRISVIRVWHDDGMPPCSLSSTVRAILHAHSGNNPRPLAASL